MAINPKYVISPNLQEVFFDVRTGLLMSNGTVAFYSDINREQFKNVYVLQGNEENYTFTALPNPLTLNAFGMPVDNAGNIIRIYYYPWLDSDESVQELYFIKVYNSTGAEQFSRQAWPGYELSSNGGGTAELNDINLIPNGQLLAHTDLAGTLVAGENVLAQGGFEAVLPVGVTSINTYSFVENPAVNIPQDPRFLGRLSCTSAVVDELFKKIRIKFDNVYKFQDTGEQVYQFGFWAYSNISLNSEVQVLQNFGTGGSPEIPNRITPFIISLEPTFFSFSIVFSNYETGTLGPLNDDFIALEILLPTDVAFDFYHTNFVLVASDIPIGAFPIQTDADMLTRGIAGWMDTPNPDGSDLYLPPLLTRKGMKWDDSSIGRIEEYPYAIPSPNSMDADTNLMSCDGTGYVSSQYSALGIPYFRLGNKLIAKSPILNIPLFGTGTTYATAYTCTNTNLLRLTVNSAGAGSVAAANVTTPFTIGSIVTYGSSTTGSASLGYNAYSNVANTVLAVGTFATPNAVAGAGTSGFTVTALNSFTGLLAQQNIYALTILATSAVALANPSAPGKYFLFSNSTTNYYVWFQLTNETDPAVVGATGIQVNLDNTYTAQDVANIVRETMNAYQISTILISSAPTAGQYFTFSANPGSPATFFVWYEVNGLGNAPVIPSSTGVKVSILSADTTAEIVLKTQLAINSYQYAAPNFIGMFGRMFDFSAIYDSDVAQRWSSISGLSGANFGTFEFEQFLSHIHVNNTPTYFGGAGFNLGGQSPVTTTGNAVWNTNATGGTETRPVNYEVTKAIRY